MGIEKRIREIYEKRNLTPGKFAEMIGVSQATVSHMISGRNKPSMDVIEKIINTFKDIDANWLILGNEGSRTAEQLDVFNSNKQDEIQEKRHSQEKTVPSIKQKLDFNPKIQKIILVYEDNTFQEVNPR